MKFTQIPTDTFKTIQMNAGILVDTFDPATGEIGNLLGATTGGFNFTATAEKTDFGEDIDNCPKNTMELMQQDSWDATMSGTFVTVTPTLAHKLAGAADIDKDDPTHIMPRADILVSDFGEVWWVGDYSNLNGDKNGGFCAIHLKNTLSTGGFQIQTTDKGKGNFAFEFKGHYSIEKQKEVPFEIFIKMGEEEDPAPTPTPTPTYTVVTPEGTENPSELGWYELVNGEYVLSTDTEVDLSKTYYTQD